MTALTLATVTKGSGDNPPKAAYSLYRSTILSAAAGGGGGGGGGGRGGGGGGGGGGLS
jgi:hypothetical protein